MRFRRAAALACWLAWFLCAQASDPGLPPADVRADLRQLIGDYVSAGSLLRIAERNGSLVVLDGQGREVPRRDYPPVARITPLRPVAELRREALRVSPPVEQGPFRSPDLVELRPLDKTIRYDIRYASGNNFLGTPIYSRSRAMLQRPAAEALVRAQRKLKSRGFGLLIHDAYRPWFVTWIFWGATPPEKRDFVADPAKGSRHNRGCAVDLTLYDLRTGHAVEMPGAYDEMSDRSYPSYPGGTSLQRWRRDLLRWAMESEGFTVYPYEWWHFDYRDSDKYPILNIALDQVR
jgi:D-alanyl-D-alanine dipeptidase